MERHWKSGRGYALRFRAYGERQYLTLGPEAEGWNRKRAEEELANVMADVRRGIWVPPTRRPRRAGAAEAVDAMPTFGSFARSLMAARKGEMSEANYAYKENALAHILPYFDDWPLHELDIQAVDAFRGHMVEVSEARRRARESDQPMRNEWGQALRPLSPATINKTIDTLQWVLSVAVEYRYISENPAAGRRRRLRAKGPAPVHLDSVEQIATLLEAAGQLDRDKRWLTNDRRPIIATLLFAGPRAGELCNLRWRDVDLANGRIRIGRSKTQAGLREIVLLPLLRDELSAHKARAYRSGADDPVFPTGTGGHRDKDNLRNRILASAVERADHLLEARGQTPLPHGVTPHKLRHTFASILIATGDDPASVMAQLGHTDPKFTLRVYTHIMRRGPAERAQLNALVKGDEIEPASLPTPE